MTRSKRKSGLKGLSGRAAGFLLAIGVLCGAVLPASAVVAAAGREVGRPSLPSFDRALEEFMKARKIPGGALAVVKEGRLVYARGYGLADRETRTSVTAASLFRIASVSKPVTAVAIMKLAEEGKLSLDARVFELLRVPPAESPRDASDPRLNQITIRQLLNHTGGWDREKSFDPMFRPKTIAEAVGVPPPAGAAAIVRYMRGRPLDFDPGTRYAYSNFGYCLLGRVIEQVTGMPYETYVKQNILAPLGVTRMWLGHSLAEARAEGEVCYYTAGDRAGRNVVSGTPATVPAPDGTFYLEAMDAHGGWLASVVDLARFAAALDRPSPRALLKPETLERMYARPGPPPWRKPDGSPTDYYYACGWLVRPVAGSRRANYWHNGSLPGTYALLVRRWDGLSWAVLFNQRSEDKGLPDGAIDPALHRAANAVVAWPAGDLFARDR